MTTEDLRAHIEQRRLTPAGTLARTEQETHAGQKGELHVDVNPIGLAFIRAAHEQPCDCVHCECGR